MAERQPKKPRSKALWAGALLTVASGIGVLWKNSHEADANKRPEPDKGMLMHQSAQVYSEGKHSTVTADFIRSDPHHLDEMGRDLETLGVPKGSEVARRYDDVRRQSYDTSAKLSIPFNNKGKEGEITMFFCPQTNPAMDGNRMEITVDGLKTSWGQTSMGDTRFAKDEPSKPNCAQNTRVINDPKIVLQ